MTDEKAWFKLWPSDVPKQLDYPQISLHEVLTQTAQKHPKQAAIAFLGAEYSYEQLDALSSQFSAALVSLGVKKGDCVAVYLPNVPQFIIAYFGILKAGAALTAISPLHREREVEHQLTDSKAKALITLDSLLPVVQAVQNKTSLQSIILTNLTQYAQKPPTPTILPQTPNIQGFPELLAKNINTTPTKVPINPAEDLAALQYTGGTTGTAKAAMLTHQNLVANAFSFASWIKGEVTKETYLTALPLFHIYGMTTSMTSPIVQAAKMVLLPKFDPTTALQTIQKHKVTVFCGVPTMYAILLNNPELGKYDLTSIRACISGASPLPPQVQKTFMEITGGLLAEGYGLTEASPVTHCSPVDKTMKTVKVGSIGLPIPGTDAKIVDLETGTQTLPPTQTGELAVKGPQVMKGYWQRPDETALVLRDGWLLTGDIAHMDEYGYFYITDRKKDLIKYKDYSVYPREIEDVLYEHPAVKLCTVIGKPDPMAGEIPKAFIVLKDNTQATADEIKAFVNQKVAPYKAIREIEIRPELPLSSAGKVLRRTLRDQEKQKQP
ncbi:MAG: long-chain fatty acid--CoA ligase [Candidatus Bathyarchaeota archaeon]|nr:long-chain fatty acid--CoA ligase [Candidatus Bathyarchaeota archaeon]